MVKPTTTKNIHQIIIKIPKRPLKMLKCEQLTNTKKGNKKSHVKSQITKIAPSYFDMNFWFSEHKFHFA